MGQKVVRSLLPSLLIPVPHMRTMQSRRWCFTKNNYSAADEILLQDIDCKYLVYGREVGEQGTPHLQGFIIFKVNKRLGGLNTLIQCHWETTKGTSLQAATYCKKDNDFFEKGRLSNPESQGRRNDLDDFKNAVKDGQYNIKELREAHSEVLAKYPRFCAEYLRDQIPDPPLDVFPLKDWQADLYDRLKLPPDDRKIIFVVDKIGNTGKSWFSKYYKMMHEDTTVIMRPGKHADMAYSLPLICRVLFLDCTRKQAEYMPYTFMEECKDGLVHSTKYECCTKKYPNMHLIVLMNQDPDENALSCDRYIYINPSN